MDYFSRIICCYVNVFLALPSSVAVFAMPSQKRSFKSPNQGFNILFLSLESLQFKQISLPAMKFTVA